jgi:hypothetical protein
MLRIESYSKEILVIEHNSIHEYEIIKEWIKEELIGIKDIDEISNTVEELLKLKKGEKHIVWHNDKQLLKIEKAI